MEEIEKENAEAPAELGPGRVLIAAEDDRTCSQLKEVCVGSYAICVSRSWPAPMAQVSYALHIEYLLCFTTGEGL